MDNWSHMWLTRKQFNTRHPDLMCFLIGNTVQLNTRDEATEEDNDNNQVVVVDVTQNSSSTTKLRHSNHRQTCISDYATNNIGDTLMEDNHPNVTYKDLVDCCAELCRTVSNGKDISRSVYSTFH